MINKQKRKEEAWQRSRQLYEGEKGGEREFSPTSHREHGTPCILVLLYSGHNPGPGVCRPWHHHHGCTGAPTRGWAGHNAGAASGTSSPCASAGLSGTGAPGAGDVVNAQCLFSSTSCCHQRHACWTSGFGSHASWCDGLLSLTVGFGAVL